MTTIEQQLEAVHQRLHRACEAAGRSPQSVRLLAVSKTFGPEAVAQAMQAGQRHFGENYIQEGVEKMLSLANHPQRADMRWHCIGPVQGNKTRLVAQHFDWVQSIDRLKIAQRLSDQRPDGWPDLQVCIQINVDGGPTKSGVGPHELHELAHAVAALPRLRLRGLMCIPEPAPDFESAKAVFTQARVCFDRLSASGLELDTLSMGMSSDVEAAVAAGSTMVRVGTAIFGGRHAT